MSDMREVSFLSGNIGRGSGPGVHGPALSYSPRRLVEECVAVSIADLQRGFGRKTLLAAVNNAHPLQYRLEGQWFEIYFLTEPMPTGRHRTLDDGPVRMWVSCPRCCHRARKLYTFPLLAGSQALADLRCRKCHNLVYQSQHCCKNRWWKDVAMPVKRLLRKRQRLLARKQSAKVQAKLEEVNRLIWITQQRAKPKSSSRKRLSQSTGMKRPYRDLEPIIQSLPC